MKFYDKGNKRIIIFEKLATYEFWDKQWQTDNFAEKVKAGKNNRFIKKFTSKFLQPGEKILEGGCGIGQNVYGLKVLGYDAYGVDFAKNTISKIKEHFPEIKVYVQDVRKLDFPDNFFSGYWSLGVIEHSGEGYDEILKEAKRVIKPGGYLFLTFPYMSPLRKLKAKTGIYELFESNLKFDNFYQSILDYEKVKSDVEKYAFELVLKHPFDATKGLKDEVSWLRPILQKIYDSQNILAKGLKFVISSLLSGVSGHCILLVFRNEKKDL